MEDIGAYIDLETYVDLHLVNPANFIEESFPVLHPSSSEYKVYWKEQRRRCIEGHWVSGVWMPGKLYFYVNAGTIKRNVKRSIVKQYARPLLHDLEWMFFYNWEEARGFSGFEKDPTYSCHRGLTIEGLEDNDLINLFTLVDGKIDSKRYSNLFKEDGTRKIYISARQYLRKVHSGNYGRPLHYNEAKNLMMLGSRGFGKSYSVGCGIIGQEWLFDGITEYIPAKDVKNTVEIVVGAADAKYSGDLLDKTKTTIEHLPGAFESYDRIYPSPFFKQYSGSWQPAKQVTATYKKKIGGQWVNAGTKSNIKHRTFRDNAFAAQGTRPGILVYEEVGMFQNLLECYGATVENQRDGSRKFGSMMFLGTGGDFEGGGTRDAHEMFYNPDKYDLLEFEDIWEYKGKIAYFVPAYLGLRDKKDIHGNSDIKASIYELENERRKLREAKGTMKRLEEEMQNRPVKPSEMFLAKTGNFFPLVEMKERLAYLESIDSENVLEKKVELYFDSKATYGVNYKLDIENKLRPINKFPWNDSNRDGCVVIFEFPLAKPNGEVPDGLYIIGHDPVATESTTGQSLAATYVLKTKKYWGEFGHDELVAVYIGRPYEGRQTVNENLLKLSMFYGNAKIYFENSVGNVKEYFEKMKRLDLLARQPVTVFNKRASFSAGPSIIYGYPMANRQFKLDGIQYVREWLLEERGEENGKITRNLDRIWDKALLQELISFDLEGNYDRVMGLMGCIVGLNEIHNQYENTLKKINRSNNSIDLSSLVNSKIFKPQETAHETVDTVKNLDIDWKRFTSKL